MNCKKPNNYTNLRNIYFKLKCIISLKMLKFF